MFDNVRTNRAGWGKSFPTWRIFLAIKCHPAEMQIVVPDVAGGTSINVFWRPFSCKHRGYEYRQFSWIGLGISSGPQQIRWKLKMFILHPIGLLSVLVSGYIAPLSFVFLSVPTIYSSVLISAYVHSLSFNSQEPSGCFYCVKHQTIVSFELRAVMTDIKGWV